MIRRIAVANGNSELVLQRLKLRLESAKKDYLGQSC